jgi:hypothetical protein
MKYRIFIAILFPIAFSAALALADDPGRTMDGGMTGGGMMGGSRGSMMGGDRRGGMMGGGMEGCMQMMQGRSGTRRPNEQWRQR